MAEDTTGLNIPIGADPSGLRQGFQEAESIVSQGAQRIQRSLQGISNVGQQLAGLGAVLSASITLPLVALAKESVQAYGEIQALNLGLEAVAGSASFAAKQFRDLQGVAKLPGLGLKEAVKGSINLQAIGYSAKSSEKILLQFGNAVASVGKGRVEFERAIYGVTQLANTDFPLGEDLNIIKDALPQVSTLLKAAFGTSRTEDLQKLKISSKQVMDVILTGLEKLPRVNGGIKNAFENLGDSIQQSLGRIGKIIDDRLNISEIIDKLTAGLDKLISAFEELSPGMQKTILVTLGIVAAIGPLALAIGGILTALPILTAGFAALGTTLTYLLTLITPLNIVLGVLAYGLYDYYIATERASDRQERFADALTKASISAKNEVGELDKLYKSTQNHNLSLEERNKAVDQLQKQYPYYFANLSNEAILAGKAGLAYKNLTVDIVNASRARVAQAELDKRNEKRLEKQLEVTNRLKRAYAVLNNATVENVREFNKEGLFDNDVILFGGNIFDEINASEAEIKVATKKYIKNILTNYGQAVREANREDAPVLKILESGLTAISKLDTPGADNFLPGLDKVKKETEKQIAEIFPVGSIAELRQRADLLTKAIETSINGIVKVRGLDKFGKDKDKKGNPYFTGEIIGLEFAYERLLELKTLIGDIQLEPIKFNSKGLLDQFGNEYKSFNDFMFAQVQKTGQLLASDLPGFIDKAAMETLTAKLRLEEALEEVNKSLNNIITSQITNGISDAFSAIGKSLATGNDLFKSLGQSLLASFGSILSELGKQMIQYGVGLLAIKIAMKSLNPYVAIAAGAALVALGAGISATVSKQSESIGGSGSGVSSASGVPSSGFTNSTVSNGSSGGGEYVFRLSGPDLIAVFNRNVSAQDKVTAG